MDKENRRLIIRAIVGDFSSGAGPLVRGPLALRVFLTCDGFGALDVASWRQLGIGWDTSHVRDSSSGALYRAATLLRALAPEACETIERAEIAAAVGLGAL